MALVLCLAMWSCGSDDETTMPSLDGEEGDTYSPMDYSKEDLSKYVKVGQYKGLSITRPVVSESELDEYIAMLVESIPSYEKITDRATAEGDYVNISFVGMLDGVAFEGGTSDNSFATLSLEANEYIDGFINDLFGIMPGTTVETVCVFPENYGNADLAGKEVTFTITLKYIAGEEIASEFTDEFVKENFGFETAAECREDIRTFLQAEADASYEEDKLGLMWQEIMESSEIIELPQSQIMFYYTFERSYYEMYAMQNGISYDLLLQYIGATDDDIFEGAKTRVFEEIVVNTIANAEGIAITEAEYKEALSSYAAGQGMSESDFLATFGEEVVREGILWYKVVNILGEMNRFGE